MFVPTHSTYFIVFRLGASYPLSPLEGGHFFPGTTSTLTRIPFRWTAPFLDHNNDDHVGEHVTDQARVDDEAGRQEEFRPRKTSWLKKYKYVGAVRDDIV